MEFARQRARWEGWSPGQRWLHIMASPLRTLAVLQQARAAANAAGWAGAFRNSFALQALFQAAWTTGEARGWMQG